MRYLTLLPLLALLACSESTTAPTAETPDPFWSGTKPAVRVTVLEGTKDAPATDRVGRVRIDVLWDSTWTPGAKDRRVGVSGEADSALRYATVGRNYFAGEDTLGQSPSARANTFDAPVVRTLTLETDVYCRSRVPQLTVSAVLVAGLDSVVTTAGVVLYCEAPR
jgi:hypothetical protein